MLDAYIPFWEMGYLFQNQCAPIQSLRNICYSLACRVGCVEGTGLGPSHPGDMGVECKEKHPLMGGVVVVLGRTPNSRVGHLSCLGTGSASPGRYRGEVETWDGRREQANQNMIQ